MNQINTPTTQLVTRKQRVRAFIILSIVTFITYAVFLLYLGLFTKFLWDMSILYFGIIGTIVLNLIFYLVCLLARTPLMLWRFVIVISLFVMIGGPIITVGIIHGFTQRLDQNPNY